MNRYRTEFPGPLGQALDRIAELAQAAAVVGNSHIRVKQAGTRGQELELVNPPQPTSAAAFGLRRLTVTTEFDFWLECTDGTNTFLVAKPDHLYSAPATGVLVQSLGFTGSSSNVANDLDSVVFGVSTANVGTVVFDNTIADTDAPNFFSHGLQRKVTFAGQEIVQVIVSPYIAGESVIYAAPLSTPLDLDGTPVAFIDVNIEGRTWVAVNYSPHILDGSLLPNGPVTFTRGFRNPDPGYYP